MKESYTLEEVAAFTGLTDRTLRILEQERTIHNFFASISPNILFRYTSTPPMLSLSPVGSQRLGLGGDHGGPLPQQACAGADRLDQLAELAQRFNGMVTALKCNQEQLVDNQRELNQAQIRMLQAQLNPHFLCNTLDTMKWISKINRVPQVALMSTNLADILRFCISPEEFASLRREVEILERYVEIQEIRMSGAFAFRVELPEELADCLIPK